MIFVLFINRRISWCFLYYAQLYEQNNRILWNERYPSVKYIIYGYFQHILELTFSDWSSKLKTNRFVSDKNMYLNVEMFPFLICWVGVNRSNCFLNFWYMNLHGYCLLKEPMYINPPPSIALICRIEKISFTCCPEIQSKTF